MIPINTISIDKQMIFATGLRFLLTRVMIDKTIPAIAKPTPVITMEKSNGSPLSTKKPHPQQTAIIAINIGGKKPPFLISTTSSGGSSLSKSATVSFGFSSLVTSFALSYSLIRSLY